MVALDHMISHQKLKKFRPKKCLQVWPEPKKNRNETKTFSAYYDKTILRHVFHQQL